MAVITLTPDEKWATPQMWPVRFTVDGSDATQTLDLPETSTVAGESTQLIVSVIDVSEAVKITAQGTDTVNGEAEVAIEVAGDYTIQIGSSGNWLVSGGYIAKV